jgi:RNA polymerase III subunit Rpc25
LVGRIASSNKEGIKVSLEFFEDVFIPSYLLQTPSEFREETSTWVWKYNAGGSEEEGGENGEGEAGGEFAMNVGEQIRFRVRTINFTRLTMSYKGVQATTTSEIHNGIVSGTSSGPPGAPGAAAVNVNVGIGMGSGLAIPAVRRQRSSSSIGLGGDESVLPAVMQVVGCANEDGLGLVSWWCS